MKILIKILAFIVEFLCGNKTANSIFGDKISPRSIWGETDNPNYYKK